MFPAFEAHIFSALDSHIKEVQRATPVIADHMTGLRQSLLSSVLLVGSELERIGGGPTDGGIEQPIVVRN